MNVKKLYGSVLMKIGSVIGLSRVKCFDARLRFHRKLNLKNPQSLADKVCYIELNNLTPLASLCSDKWAVREYLQEKGYGRLLKPVVGGPWSSIEEIDFQTLPEQFMLKATHGSKMNYAVSDITQLNKEECLTELNRWLNNPYGSYSIEPHYLRISPRIYAEELLSDVSDIVDYKFYCLNGIPRFVEVDYNRHIHCDDGMIVTFDVYDENWKPVSGLHSKGQVVPGSGSLPKPAHYDEMLSIAKELSKDFIFVRVDLFEYKDKVLFSELTFTPECGVMSIFPEDFLAEMGKLLTLPGEEK